MRCLNPDSCSFFFLLSLLCAGVNGNAKVPAVFTFGDSLVDPGNNNFIPSIAKANHAPYGQDFKGHENNGRFSNGKLATDFIASGLGVKETIPPYLDPDLSTQELLTGVSFGSAGTGFDNLTSDLVRAIPMWRQIELFKQYKERLEYMVGTENSSKIIEDSIFLIVAGSNDFIVNYLFVPNRRYEYTVQEYQEFLLEISSNFIEEVYKLGARKLGVSGLPPLGCVPAEKTLYGQSEVHGCMEIFNDISSSYNEKQKEILRGLEARLPGIRVEYLDIYNNVLDIIKNLSLYGMEIADRGCCGTGLVEAGPICNQDTPITCRNTSTTVFWDSVHPTQATYEIVADLVLRQNLPNLLL